MLWSDYLKLFSENTHAAAYQLNNFLLILRNFLLYHNIQVLLIIYIEIYSVKALEKSRKIPTVIRFSSFAWVNACTKVFTASSVS